MRYLLIFSILISILSAQKNESTKQPIKETNTTIIQGEIVSRLRPPTPIYFKELLKGRKLYSDRNYLKAHETYKKALQVFSKLNAIDSEKHPDYHYQVLAGCLADSTIALAQKFRHQGKIEQSTAIMRDTLLLISNHGQKIEPTPK